MINLNKQDPAQPQLAYLCRKFLRRLIRLLALKGVYKSLISVSNFFEGPIDTESVC
jgi:hypothetical protein